MVLLWEQGQKVVGFGLDWMQIVWMKMIEAYFRLPGPDMNDFEILSHRGKGFAHWGVTLHCVTLKASKATNH